MDADTKDLIERIRQQFESYMAQTNSKLDMLIDIMRQVAVMQSVQEHHTSELTSLEAKINSVESDSTRAITRAHERIDDLIKATETRISEIKNTMGECGTHCHEYRQGISDSIGKVDRTYDRKLHYVRGAMWVAGLVALAIPTVAAKYYGDLTDAIKSLQAQVEKNTIIIQENDRRLDMLKERIK